MRGWGWEPRWSFSGRGPCLEGPHAYRCLIGYNCIVVNEPPVGCQAELDDFRGAW